MISGWYYCNSPSGSLIEDKEFRRPPIFWDCSQIDKWREKLKLPNLNFQFRFGMFKVARSDNCFQDIRLTPCSGNNLCVDLGSGVPKQTIDIFNLSASLAQSIWMFIIHFLQRYPVRSTNGPYFIALSGTRFSSSRGTSPVKCSNFFNSH